MAEDINKKGMHNGFETLVKAIEELAGNKVDLSSLNKKDDVATLRAMDAKRASIELAKERLENHKSFVNSIYESKKVLPNNNFEKAIQDEMNKDAIAAAKSFCYMAFLSGQFSAAPPLFLLQGPAGTGKTYICNCIANEVLNKKFKDVEICDYGQIKKARVPSQADTSYDIEAKNKSWQRFISVDLLILDGLCKNNEALTAYDRQVLPELLRVRRSNNLPMVITTPLHPTMMHNHLGDECFESLKDYSVLTAALFGTSRRQPILFGGARLN